MSNTDASNKPPYPGRLVFHHLPKTAGQAINAWLRGELGNGCVSPNLDGQYADLVRRYGGRYSVISGHMYLNYGEPLDARYLHVTLLREPVDRAVSWLSYLLTDDVANAQNSRLVEGAKRFMQSEGVEATPEFLKSISNYVTGVFSVVGPSSTTETGKMVDAAFATLADFNVVGLYEEMLHFLRDVAGLIQICAPDQIEVVNQTTKRPKVSELSDALRKRIIELNFLDLRLYEKVKKRVLDSHSVAGWHAFPPPSISRWARFDPRPDRSLSSSKVTFASTVIVQPCDTTVVQGQLLAFELVVKIHTRLSSSLVGIHIFDSDKRLVFGTNSGLLGHASEMDAPGVYRVCFTLIANFPIGTHTAGFAIVEMTSEGDHELAWRDVSCTFHVKSDCQTFGPGYSPVPTTLTVTRFQGLQP